MSFNALVAVVLFIIYCLIGRSMYASISKRIGQGPRIITACVWPLGIALALLGFLIVATVDGAKEIPKGHILPPARREPQADGDEHNP